MAWYQRIPRSSSFVWYQYLHCIFKTRQGSHSGRWNSKRLIWPCSVQELILQTHKEAELDSSVLTLEQHLFFKNLHLSFTYLLLLELLTVSEAPGEASKWNLSGDLKKKNAVPRSEMSCQLFKKFAHYSWNFRCSNFTLFEVLVLPLGLPHPCWLRS